MTKEVDLLHASHYTHPPWAYSSAVRAPGS